jgi:PAS domain S-box-containing protein
MKILAIDDNKDNLISLKALIKDVFPDALTLTAASGRKGLELAASEDPDVILLDIVMPGMDGFDVCRKLKADKNLSDIPVVFITALKGDRDSRVRALDCGADAFLSKPVDDIELTAQIRSMMKIKSSNTEKRDEKKRLASLVEAQTRELKEIHRATMNLLEDLKKENEARRESEEALRDREEMYRVLVKNLPDIVVRFDRDGRLLFVSDNVSETVGLKPEQIIGKTCRELGFTEELSQLCGKGIENVLNNGMHFESEYTSENKKGIRIHNLQLIPEHDEQGAIQSILAISRDITEHRLAEENYRILFREMLEGFALHEIICDEEGKPADYRFLAVNPAFERMTGLKAEKIISRTVLEVLPETERHWIETYGKVALTGEPVFFVNYSAGLKKYFEITAFRPAYGRFACIFSDITVRKLVERRQILSTEVLGILTKPLALHDMITGVIAAIKRGGDFDAVGVRLKTGDDFPYFGQEGFSNDFLLTENTLIERNMDGGVCMGKDGKPCLLCTCGLVISGKTDPANPLFTQGGSFWTNDLAVLLELLAEQDPRFHPRNRCIHEGYKSIAMIPIRANREIIGLLQLNNWKKDSLNIDMIHFFEGLCASIGVSLMHKQAESEKANMEKQLRESQKMEAIGLLAGGISHDFNNLLSVINGYSQVLLLDPDLKAVARLSIEEILRSGERASALTRQLLVFSRRQITELRNIDLDTVISDMERMLRRLIREDITVTRNIAPGLWQIKADPGSIEQVIMNLIINASDAMPDGGTLTIETENIKIESSSDRYHHGSDIKPGSYVMLSIRDTGCGMDDNVREHIFEPFFTTKDVGKGTGLGLATVYGIVKQSNAFIDVQSEPGKGTTFLIYFPRVVDEETADQEHIRTVTTMPRGSETILLAEDEDIIRRMLQDFLRSIGYAVLSASNGKEALELAQKHKGEIHLLLTDIVMPKLNGFELSKQLRNLFPEIKLLFMSGYAKPADIHKMIGVTNNLIDKPINLYAMAVKIREVLGREGE